MERQLHSGFQLYVSLAGEVIADNAVGVDALGRSLDRESISLWLSAGKPLSSVAILKLVEQKQINLDTRVAEVIPEFAQNRKDNVTIQNLLTHTGGFPNAETAWPIAKWSESITRICSAELEVDWVVGETSGYHPAASWFILGEVIARVDGRPFAEFLRLEVCEPIGLTEVWNGLPEEVFHSRHITAMAQRERGETQILEWHSIDHCKAPSPGVNTRGPIRELGWFYEWLLRQVSDSQNDSPVLSREQARLMVHRHREGKHDLTLGHPVDFGLGVIVNSNRYGAETVPYGFGKHCSEATFGHGGAQSSTGFADPANDLVVAWSASTRVGEGQHQKRNRLINSAIYEDLGLTSTS